MAVFEDRHWWYGGLRSLVVESLARAFPGGLAGTVVDVGCGTGGTLAAVRARFAPRAYVGIDVELRALAHCRRRGLASVVQASANALPLRPASADAMLCLDVLYYASIDPRRALSRFYETLRPGGVLVLNLPAFESLRGEHDAAVGIARRFRRPDVRALCEEAGFRVQGLTYWNAALFLPMLLWRWLSRWRRRGPARSDVGREPRWLDAVGRRVLAAEVAAARWVGLPFGSSLFVVARRPVGAGPAGPGG